MNASCLGCQFGGVTVPRCDLEMLVGNLDEDVVFASGGANVNLVGMSAPWSSLDLIL
jgi:hypothetical protein